MKHHSIMTMTLGLLVACSSNAASSNTSSAATQLSPDHRGPGHSFIASAPPGLSLNDLGRPFTADFRRFQGSEGQSLFPEAGPVLRTTQHLFEHDADSIDSDEELAANAGAWGMKLGLEEHSASRYASLRVLEIDHVHEIDDTTAMRRPPRDAAYYPWRVYMGRSYEVVLEGSAEQFNASVRASLLVFTGDVADFARQHELRHSVRARGLAPRTDRAIFAKTTAEIEKLYRATIDEPVPILVQWRRIPGRQAPSRSVEWKELRQGCPGEPGCEPCGRWSFHRVEVGIPRSKQDGRAWDADGSEPDVVLILRAAGDTRTSTKQPAYRRTWTLSPAVLVDPGENLRLRAIDKDLMVDDPIFTLNARPGETLRDGRLEFGSGSAVAFGRCASGGQESAEQTGSPANLRRR